MNPLLLALLATGGSALLGRLLQRGDPTQQNLQRILEMLSSENINREAAGIEKTLLNSPGYATAQDQIGAATNMLRNSLSRSLGARGLGTSGIAAVAVPGASSAGAFQLGELRARIAELSRKQAFDQISTRAGLAAQVQPPNLAFEFGGKALQALLPLLLQSGGQQQQQGGTSTLFRGF